MRKIYLVAAVMIAFIANSFGQSLITDDVSVYTDPVKKTLKIVYSSSEKTPLNVIILNQSGQTVYSCGIPGAKGESVKIIDLSIQPKGTYTIEMENEKLKQVELFVFN